MSRHSLRDIVLLMAREIDPQESSPEDEEYISTWEIEHSCGGDGDPSCAQCWMLTFDARYDRVLATIELHSHAASRETQTALDGVRRVLIGRGR